MLDAICEFVSEQGEKTRITYQVFTFARMPEEDIDHLRQRLFCPACGGQAYFRKASKDGKAACFGSRYHKLGCIESKPSAQKSREEHDAIEVQQQLVDADALLIDFSLKPSKPKPRSEIVQQTRQHTITIATRDISTQKLTIGTVQEAKADYRVEPIIDAEAHNKRVPSQGLEKLLHSLLRGSDLATSDLWVYTDSERKYRWRAKNLFVNFADADPSDNKPHMYWGTISHSDPSLSWLNPADSKDIGIPIDAVKTKLFKQFDITDKRDLEGASLILFGKCFWNKEKTRKIIHLWNNELQRIFISKLEDE